MRSEIGERLQFATNRNLMDTALREKYCNYRKKYYMVFTEVFTIDYYSTQIL